jgi:hypothetical protein
MVDPARAETRRPGSGIDVARQAILQIHPPRRFESRQKYGLLSMGAALLRTPYFANLVGKLALDSK